MASRVPKSAPAKLPGIQVGQITNFSGGPNFRDSPTELAATESYDTYNVTFDERGGVQSRLGYAKRNLSPLGSNYASAMLAQSPSLYWRLDEKAGAQIAQDASGNGNSGTYGSRVTLGQPGLLTGDPDAAASFSHSSPSFVAAKSYAPYASGSSRTFLGLANRTTSTGEDPLFGALGNSPARLTIAAGSSDVSFYTGASNSVTWAGAWPGTGVVVHWGLTYNDSTKVAELFINGVSKGQLTLGGAYSEPTDLFRVGQWYRNLIPNTWASFNGTIDEVAVFPSILSGATISALYTAATTPPSLGAVTNDFYSSFLGNFITQVGTALYYNGSSVKTFTTNACVTFAELGGKVIAGHPVDGLWYSTNGSTWTQITSANAPTTANCIKTWMSKLFVGMADGTVHWSAASDPLTWASTDFNAIWTKDQKPIVALAIGSGQDIQGRPGLLAFKQDSVYRINDSGNGAYTVLDTQHGAAGPKAVVGVGARVCWIGRGGIFWWREDQGSPINASDLLRPLWRNEQLSFSNQSGWAAGRRLNRAYFSCSSNGSSVNDIAIEFHPDEGWVTLGSNAMTCYSVDQNEQTYGGSPTAPGQMYQLDTGGLDDGSPISGWFQTRWIVPNGNFQAQVWQLRLQGRGSGVVEFRKDYEDSTGTQYTVTYPTTGWFYDSGATYDSGISYIDPVSAASVSLSGQGVCRQFSIRFSFTTTSTFVGRQIATAPAPVYGGCALYGVEALFVPLGLS